ncbi:nibrin [Melanaphis sacchari]|uniref:Nibrin n=1 Tax=Melanaphis sacchari TaxID=742174 RepID=A0A2H8TQ28_9HEMI|nr:nibrin [Melanaphis sacchari]
MDCDKQNDILLYIPTLMNVETQECYDILMKKTHMIGRAGFGADLEISDDTSISRCHAHLILLKKIFGSKAKLFLILEDKKSKYGTFINDFDERIISDCPKILKFGDKIRFGILNSIWTVVKYPLIVCPSTLKMADKEILKNLMEKIGGQVSRDWSEKCSHLCMNSVTVTEKVLLCLTSAKSIVLLKYFIDLHEALSPDSLSELPFCVDYKPKLVESLLNPNSLSLDVNIKRKKLFSGKTFICSTINQLNRISKLVKLAGGEIMNYSDKTLSDDDILSCSNYILMQQDSRSTEVNNTYQRILEKLRIMNKRSIPENEIGFAIIFSSTARHCNVDFNVSLVNLESQSNVIKSQESIILAPETEVLTVNDSEIFSVNTIPDSIVDTQCAFKRPLEVVMDSEEIIIPTKRPLLADNEEKMNNIKTLRVEEDLHLSQRVIEPTPSSSNHDMQCPASKTSTVDNVFTNNNSCLTAVPSSLYISNSNQLSTWLKGTVAENSLNNANNLLSKTTENEAVSTVPTKRKISNNFSIFNNENENPFDYLDIDEIEEHPKKKPKKRVSDSLFLSVVDSSSNNKDEPSKTVKNNVNDEAVDPNFIMNLLSEAKGTGQFIDASILSEKSSADKHEDTEHDYNSIIVETKNMVVSKNTQITNFSQQNNTNLKNFKKFKKKGPIMRIPYIVPMEYTQID